MKIARSLVDYLDRRLGKHSGSGPEYLYPCPACIDRIGSESNKRKFAINLNVRKGQCFRCEFKFRDIEALFRYINAGHITIEEKMLLREDPPIVVGSVPQTVRRILYKEDESARPLRPCPLPREYKALTADTVSAPELRRAHAYLRKRHVPLKTALRFHVGFCATGQYAGYLIFPVVQGGGVVYWTSRYTGNTLIKSHNPPKRDGYFSREHCILNYDNVVGKRVVTLVEGPISATAPRHACALLGRVMSPFQEKLIAALVPLGLEELVIGLDPGTGRDREFIRDKLVDVVPRVTDLLLEEGDPDDERDRIEELTANRRVPTLTDRIRSRLTLH